MRFAILLLSVLAAACYQPRLPAGKYLCAMNEECPAHLVCAGGLCVDPSSADLAGADLRAGGPADLLGDPCATGFIELAPQGVHACLRSFNTASGWNNLCRGGYHVCEAPRDSALLGQASASIASKCAAAGRFFIARIDISISNINFGVSPRQADGTPTARRCRTGPAPCSAAAARPRRTPCATTAARAWCRRRAARRSPRAGRARRAGASPTRSPTAGLRAACSAVSTRTPARRDRSCPAGTCCARSGS